MGNRVRIGWLLRGAWLCFAVWSILGCLCGLGHIHQLTDMPDWWMLLLGGLAPSGHLEPLSLLLWYAWLVPGMMGALLYSRQQTGGWRYFVLLRVGKADHWLGRILLVGVGWAMAYLGFGMALYSLWGYLFGAAPTGLGYVHGIRLMLSALHLAALCTGMILVDLSCGYVAALSLFLLVDVGSAVTSGIVHTHKWWLFGGIGMWQQGEPVWWDMCLPFVGLLIAFITAKRISFQILKKG